MVSIGIVSLGGAQIRLLGSLSLKSPLTALCLLESAIHLICEPRFGNTFCEILSLINALVTGMLCKVLSRWWTAPF